MTEKRFTIWELNNAQIEDNVELESYICLNERESEEMCELLNGLHEENEQLKQFKEKVFKLIDDNIQIYEDTTTNDEFLQIQLDTKLQTLYNLRKELN